MPESIVTHTVDITFTLDEIIDLLKERANHISAVDGMVFLSATTNVDSCLEDDQPQFTTSSNFILHYIAEAS